MNDYTLNLVEDAPFADGTFQGSDADNEAIAFSVSYGGGPWGTTATGAKGTVTITNPATGAFRYVPNANANGTETYSVRAYDLMTYSAVKTLTVNITSVPDVPVADSQAVATNEDTPVSITLVATDGDNDPLTYILLTQPSPGTLTGTAPNLTYTPAQDYSGADSFSFKVNDGSRDSNAATVSITVNPLADPAIASISPAQATVNGAAFTLTVTGSAFAANSVVKWGTTDLSTTFVSSTQLTAAVGTAQLTEPGVYPITVFTPNPGGGTSNAVNFYVYSGTVGASWIVTNTNDTGPGSLRQVMSDVRGGESVLFDPAVFDLTASDAATTINVKSALPAMDKGSVTIDAQDRRVTVNGSAAGSADGIVITSDGNTIVGLTVIGFTGSGIVVNNGKNNVLGGSRMTGTGPNGQGLRIANCGTYGVQITGASATGNVVKGCWLGLSASGKDMSANLAGLLIDGGAKANTIGGTGAGERNAISGNFYEGITVSGEGTDDNVVLANIIGAAAVTETATGLAAERGVDDLALASRSAVSNGSAGVFLSKGTKGTRIGGDNDADANLIAHNGGNGLEVRTPDSKRNSSKGNRISKNVKGGIGLFDGSNDGIKAPVFTSVWRLPGRTGAEAAARSEVRSRDRKGAVGPLADARGSDARAANSMAARGTTNTGGDARATTATVRITGTAGASSGAVEVFTDPEYQGGTLVGRAAVSNGSWQIEVDVSDVENITATLTDDAGNTSPFAVFGRAPGESGPAGDLDEDGVSNGLEALAETNAQDASDVPVKEGAVVVDKFGATLNFTTANKDALKATLRLILPAGYVNTGASVAVQIADVIERFATLDAKGKSPKGLATLAIKGALATPGPVTGGLLSFSVKGKDLKTGLGAAGLINKTTAGKTGETLPVPVAVAIAMADGTKHVYIGSVNVVYKAVAGKKGTGKKLVVK